MPDPATTMQPLAGIKVLDLSSLLPGPLATLLLAEAGAEVLKVERPGVGDAGRVSRLGRDGENVEFALLNRGKSSIVLDLKLAADKTRLIALVQQADVLVEQFRPGVMQRLGLDYEALRSSNPRLIYCSISGYGQDGPLAQRAGHDLNYLARMGMLSISIDGNGKPAMPHAQFADIGGGSFPAVVNILLALLQREKTGQGAYLDIAMCENSFFWARRGLAPIFAGAEAPAPGRYPHAGASARYALYLAADGIALSVAGLEQPFWNRFCELIELSNEEGDDRTDPEQVRARVADRLATKTAAAWEALFEHEDVCVERVRSLGEAVTDPHFIARGVFSQRIMLKDGKAIAALPVPVCDTFRSQEPTSYPALGADKGFNF